MKVSIDFDGTLWHHMHFFRELMKSLQAAGHQVGMLTGHSHDERHIKADIDLMLARGFPRPDFYFGRQEKDMPYNGSHMKADTIIREGIDIHFDDMDFGNVLSEKIFVDKGIMGKICKVFPVGDPHVHCE